MINEQLWIGHFDLWIQPGLVMFRQALILAGCITATSEQCEAMLAAATEACERYFAAFQYVVWAGKSAREAVDAVMFDTAGRGVERSHHDDAARLTVYIARWLFTSGPASMSKDPSQALTSLKGANRAGRRRQDGRRAAHRLAQGRAVTPTASPRSNRSRRPRSACWHGRACASIRLPARFGDVAALVIAVKPQTFAEAAPLLKPLVSADTLVVSIMAGMTIARIAAACGGAVVRAMPNTPAAIGRGITVAVPAAHVSAASAALPTRCCARPARSSGSTDEALMDAVTAVSGSGPAYVFLLAEELARAGVAAGLPADLAAKLARETVAGLGRAAAAVRHAMPRHCARTSPRPAAPPPRRWKS